MIRMRVRYSISGPIRFISHLDLMRAFFHACVRGRVPVALSQGFSPHLKISFGPPRGLGISSNEEYLDIYLQTAQKPAGLSACLQQGLPLGVRIEEAFLVPLTQDSLVSLIKAAVYSVSVPKEFQQDLTKRVKDFLNQESIIIERQRPKGKKTVDIRQLVGQLSGDKENLEMQLALTEKGSARPLEVLSCLWPELSREQLRLWSMLRKSLIGAPSLEHGCVEGK